MTTIESTTNANINVDTRSNEEKEKYMRALVKARSQITKDCMIIPSELKKVQARKNQTNSFTKIIWKESDSDTISVDGYDFSVTKFLNNKILQKDVKVYYKGLTNFLNLEHPLGVELINPNNTKNFYLNLYFTSKSEKTDSTTH